MISNMLRFPPSFFAGVEGIEDVFASEFPSFVPASDRTRAYPQVNMGITEKSVEVYLFVPGMDISALDVSLEKNLLSVSGERSNDESVDVAGDVSNRIERFSGKFKRVVTLPDDVDPEQTEAVYRNGVLHISVAKKLKAEPRKITVHA